MFKMSLLLLLMGTISSSQAQDLKEPPKPEVEYVHEFWQKGKHAKELALGSYVVVAQTTSEADAKKLITEFKHLEIPIPIYGYQSNKGFWLICFAVDGDIP